jgi:hypothetical protein
MPAADAMTFLQHHTVVKYFVESFWRDEAFSWAMAGRGFGAIPLTARDFNPPLYYLLLYGWMQVAGSSEVALRSLSLCFFIATLWVAWRFMTDLLDVPARRASLYIALFALNPALIYYAVEARMYSLLAFLATASFYAYQARRHTLYVVATTAGLYTHYFMILVVLTQIAATVVDAGMRRARVRMVAAPLLLFAPWLAVAFMSRTSGTAFWADAPGWRFALHLVTSIYTGHDATYGFLERPERWLFAACLLPFVGWTLLAMHRMKDGRRQTFRLVALWALLPPAIVLAATLFKPVFVPRYLIFSSVGLVLLLVIGLERLRTPAMRYGTLALLCALAVYYQVAQAHRYSKGEYRETIRQIAQQAGPDDLLYVRSELDFFPALYYFDPSRVFVSGRTYDQIPTYVGKVLMPPDRFVRMGSAAPSRVFVLQNDREYRTLARHEAIDVLSAREAISHPAVRQPRQ